MEKKIPLHRIENSGKDKTKIVEEDENIFNNNMF
jgi:hypothetical protein